MPLTRRDRYALAHRIAGLDPGTEYAETYRLLSLHEFPWDLNQALSFALFRTYAVPSIGRLLHETSEFVSATRKRYEDTGLLLAEVVEHGPASAAGRAAVRRVNQMHAAYDISPADMRYVLCTFVAVPIRWLDAYGWRPLTEAEKTASANYYRELGRLMAIADVPETWQGFSAALDDYELEHFGRDPGARAVADATLDLLATFPPNHLLPARLVRLTSLCLMDDPLLDALGYPRPPRLLRRAVRTALAARGRFVRAFFPPRTTPLPFRELPSLTLYPDGYDVQRLGTFPRGCPVPHQDEAR